MGHGHDVEFGAYVEQRRGHLRRTAYFLCGDWHLAEDLVQTTLARLYVAWPRLVREGREDAYARRILVNAHHDERRRPWRRERAGLDGVDNTARPAASVEDRDALIRALQALPPGQRRVVVLRHWWGASVEECAADLGISTGTVKSQTSRALDRLHELLTPDHVGNEPRGEQHGRA